MAASVTFPVMESSIPQRVVVGSSRLPECRLQLGANVERSLVVPLENSVPKRTIYRRQRTDRYLNPVGGLLDAARPGRGMQAMRARRRGGSINFARRAMTATTNPNNTCASCLWEKVLGFNGPSWL
jgi:hypothetical protein